MLQQSVQQAGLPQRREQVAVAGRAPLQIWVGRPRCRRSGGRVDLRLLMLDDLQRDVGLLELALVSQCLFVSSEVRNEFMNVTGRGTFSLVRAVST